VSIQLRQMREITEVRRLQVSRCSCSGVLAMWGTNKRHSGQTRSITNFFD
jgi:hypothetical protein